MALRFRERKKRTTHESDVTDNGKTNGENNKFEVPVDPDKSCTVFQGWLLLCLYAALVTYSVRELLYVPDPMPATAPDGMFSEARALQHVRALADDIGERQVSRPGVESAAQYLYAQLEELQYHPLLRQDIKLEIMREEASGAVNFNFLGANITNMYHNLTNVLARVTPLRAKCKWAFLVNAHFDSTMGTAGASDCASCVGIGLEALRALVLNESIAVHSPVVFLFNGGEETLMQAAHGFMNSSKWQSTVASFINLESTGPKGLPILFQHTGAWTASVYAKHAKMPRGTSLSQDFFESGLIPGDTDFKMFSASYQGRLPGLDVAFVLGGSMYHTMQDRTDNIRPGTLQEMGENLMGLVPGFTGEMAKMANGTSQESREPAAYYFPFLSYMIVYPKSSGPLLHNFPLLMLLTIPGQLHSIMRDDNVKISYFGIFHGVLLYALSVVSGLLIPAIGAALRALVLGTPLVFFAHHELAYVMYMPLAVVGLLLPAMFSNVDLPSAVFGASWLWGVAGYFATKHNLGFAVYPFLWIAPIHLAFTITIKKGHFSKILALLVTTFMASFVSITSTITMTEHVMDKVNLAGGFKGVFGVVFADTIVGAIHGVGVILMLGTLAPAAAVAMRPVRRVVLAVLLMTSIGAAVLGTALYKPYDPTHPKRVFCQHLHVVDPQGKMSSHWVVATTDIYPVEKLLQNELQQLALPVDEKMKRYLFPLSKMLQGVVLDAPGPPEGHLKGHVPYIQELKRGSADGLTAAQHPAAERVHMLVDTRAPCWGILNITGPKVLAWSLTSEIPSVPLPDNPAGSMHLIRFAGNGGSEQWQFWIDVVGQERLRVEMTAKYFDPEDEVVAFGKQFPDWVAYTGLMVYHVDWEAAAGS